MPWESERQYKGIIKEFVDLGCIFDQHLTIVGRIWDVYWSINAFGRSNSKTILRSSLPNYSSKYNIPRRPIFIKKRQNYTNANNSVDQRFYWNTESIYFTHCKNYFYIIPHYIFNHFDPEYGGNATSTQGFQGVKAKEKGGFRKGQNTDGIQEDRIWGLTWRLIIWRLYLSGK